MITATAAVLPTAGLTIHSRAVEIASVEPPVQTEAKETPVKLNSGVLQKLPKDGSWVRFDWERTSKRNGRKISVGDGELPPAAEIWRVRSAPRPVSGCPKQGRAVLRSPGATNHRIHAHHSKLQSVLLSCQFSLRDVACRSPSMLRWRRPFAASIATGYDKARPVGQRTGGKRIRSHSRGRRTRTWTDESS